MRAIAFLYFSDTSPFKHTRCQMTSSCSSRIRKPALLDLVPQKVRLSIELIWFILLLVFPRADYRKHKYYRSFAF
jgi:hypothetical protein